MGGFSSLPALLVEGGVAGVEVLRVEAILGRVERFGKALVVDDLALAEEAEGIAHVGIVDHTEQVVVGDARLLLGGEVLVQIGDDVALDADILRIERHSRGRLRIDADGVIGEIRVKARRLDLRLREVARQLMDDRRDHLKVRQFVRTPMMEIKTPHQKSLMYQEI